MNTIKSLSVRVKVLCSLLLSILTFFFIQQPLTVIAAPSSVKVDGIEFTVGKTYSTSFTAYYPTSSSGKKPTDFKNKPINLSDPNCKTVKGFPYGTKFRIFTDKSKKGTLCVVNDFLDKSGVDKSVNVSIMVKSAQEALNWQTSSGKLTLLSVGDGSTLNYTDDGSYPNPTEVVEIDPSLGLKYDNSASKAALQEEFFIKNDIAFYTPEDECVSDAENILPNLENSTEEQRAEYILRFLTGLGMTLNQAAGIVGNMVGESGIRPACLEKASASTTPGRCEDIGNRCGDGNVKDPVTGLYTCEPRDVFKTGIGLVQFGRNGKLQEISEKYGRHLYDIDIQLEALIADIVHNRWQRLFVDHFQYANKNRNVNFDQAKTVEEATFAFLDNYENPNYANTCGYGTLKRNKNGICKGETITEEAAETCYKHYVKRRVRPGEKYAEKFRGIIPDGTGFSRESLQAYLDSNPGSLTPDDETPDNVPDFCKPPKVNSSLVDMVQQTAWPLFCSRGQVRNEGGLSCDAGKPKDFYRDLIDCRKHGITNGSCKFVGGYIGHIGQPGGKSGAGQDCGGFVTTVMQESGFDTTYANGGTLSQENYLIDSDKWKLVFKHGEAFDQTQLQPGDVAICNKSIDNCSSSGHVFLFTGSIPNFEYPAASASLMSRYPMAGQEITEYNKYNWYRNNGALNEIPPAN